MKLKTKILMSVLVVSAMLNITLAVFQNAQKKSAYLTVLEHEIAATDLLLNSVNAGPLIAGDKDKLQTNLESFFINQNLSQIELSETAGNIKISLSRSIPENIGQIIKSTAFITLQGDTLGKVSTSYTTSYMEHEQRKWQFQILMQISALLFFLWLVLSLLIKRFAAPVVKLTAIAQSMAAGDLDQHIDTQGTDEVGTLARSFAAMRDSIREIIAKQAATNRDLEEEVQKRIASAAALRQSKKNLRITLNSIGDAVIATDDHGRVTQMNPVAEKLTGWRIDDAVGLELGKIFHIINPETRQEIENPVAKVLNSGSSVGLTTYSVLVALNGEERQIADSGSPMLNRHGEIIGVVLVFRDVTKEHRLQEQLAHAQKMDAIGKLAGGIAHDFNNLLTGIIGNINLLLFDLDPGTELAICAQEIETASNRASDLTRQLMSFSRKGKLQSVNIDAKTLIDEVTALLLRSVDPRIQIISKIEATHHKIVGDPSQLQSALLNLALNARDAMVDGGELTFSTKNLELDAKFCVERGFDIPHGPYLEIAVTDTGIGMDQPLQQQIFEPFFTTKKPGQGTGLGLASVYGCIQNHSGVVHVYSEVGVGSSFHVLLPLAANPGTDPSVIEYKRNAPIAGRGHVLFVDDEEIVRRLVTKSLSMLGYTVVTAENGLLGVEYFRQNFEKIDLVILDLVMPELGGEDAFRQIRQIDDQARVIIASGFSSSTTMDILLSCGALALLHKPFSIEDLSRTVAQHIRPVVQP